LTHNVRINMKPQPYDGTEDIEEYLSQFQIWLRTERDSLSFLTLVCSQALNISDLCKDPNLLWRAWTRLS
jgi:hypothetical protein